MDMQRTSCKQQQEIVRSLLDGLRISDEEAAQEGHDQRAVGDVPLHSPGGGTRLLGLGLAYFS